MLVSEAVTGILSVINNQNKSADALLWIQATLREIFRRERWFYFLEERTHNFARYKALPTDFWELQEPVFLDTDETTIPDTWTDPSAPWEFENVDALYSDLDDFRLTNFGIEFDTRWTAGGIWISYYREITIPTLTTDTIDLPEMFAYDLVVYGAAIHGLLQEDDYDRLQFAKRKFEEAIRAMKTWDARRRSANGIKRAKKRRRDRWGDLQWPANYSI